MLAISPNFSEMKGVQGGNIFQMYRGSIMIRNHRSGGGLDSERWQTQKLKLTEITSQWRTLTAPTQLAWEAAAPSFPYIDKFGNPQTPSGYQLFTTLNLNLLAIGQNTITAPPAPAAKPSIAPIALDITQAAGPWNVTWNATAAVASVLACATSAVSVGVTRTPERTRVLAAAPMGAGQPIDIRALWVATYGEPPSEGRIFLTISATDQLSGENYGRITVSDDL